MFSSSSEIIEMGESMKDSAPKLFKHIMKKIGSPYVISQSTMVDIILASFLVNNAELFKHQKDEFASLGINLSLVFQKTIQNLAMGNATSNKMRKLIKGNEQYSPIAAFIDKDVKEAYQSINEFCAALTETINNESDINSSTLDSFIEKLYGGGHFETKELRNISLNLSYEILPHLVRNFDSMSESDLSNYLEIPYFQDFMTKILDEKPSLEKIVKKYEKAEEKVFSSENIKIIEKLIEIDEEDDEDCVSYSADLTSDYINQLGGVQSVIEFSKETENKKKMKKYKVAKLLLKLYAIDTIIKNSNQFSIGLNSAIQAYKLSSFFKINEEEDSDDDE